MTGLSAYRIAQGIGAAIALAVMLTILDFAAGGPGVDANYADPTQPAVMELAHPPLPYAPNRDDSEIGFPQADAGISAYYRIPAPPTDGATDSTTPRLNVMAVVIALASQPDVADPQRAGRSEITNLGLNFGVITIPMHGPVAASTPSSTTVSVYFDDQGWIIAYLPAQAPPAAIWRYNSNNANSNLDDNYLSRAIGVVLAASGTGVAAYAGPSGYYDWQNPQCDAYVLFSNSIGQQDPYAVQFIIPEAIGSVKASAAVLIIGPTEGGSADRADLQVDGKARASASRDTAHNAVGFELDRTDGPVSQHAMTITASAGIAAAGVIMLMYDKPD